MLKRVHVNRHYMAANRKEGSTRLPAWTVKLGNGRNVKAYAVETHGHEPVSSMYQPENPMSCGAVAWLETRDAVDVWNADTDAWETIE